MDLSFVHIPDSAPEGFSILMDESINAAPIERLNLPSFTTLVGNGTSSLVFAIDNDSVLKAPFGFEGSAKDIDIELQVYNKIGYHPRIVRFIRMESRGIILEKLLYPLRKRLQGLQASNELPGDSTLLRWARQAAEGLTYLHSRGVLQADVGCHNLLLDTSDDVKLCDFAGASVDGGIATVCYETRSQKPKATSITIDTEIFAFGTALYEMSTTRPPYTDLDSCTREIDRLYAEGRFPSTENLLLGDIVRRCWGGGYKAMSEVQMDIVRIEKQTKSVLKEHHAWDWKRASSFVVVQLPKYVGSQ